MGEYARCNAIYRAAAERHAPFFPELQAALASANAHAADSRWVAYNVYRRAFDSMIVQSASAGDAECYLYYWDERDGDAWMGWWLTPEDVGCMRFWAFSRGSNTETPDRCRQWEANGRAVHLKITQLASGAMQVMTTNEAAAASCSCLGIFTAVPHAHNHKGRSVYRRTEAFDPRTGFAGRRSTACAIL